jgi:hypothetical protein
MGRHSGGRTDRADQPCRASGQRIPAVWHVEWLAEGAGSIEPVSVVITIDAEIAPHTSNWRRDCGRFAADRDIYGITERGERGLRY